jgi:ribosome maturation factor RimP
MLDVEDPVSDDYELEVSSPGADRPFFKLSQFERFVGSTVTINLFKPINKQRKITGKIEKVEGDNIVIKVADKIFDIPFQAMSKARLVPEYLVKKGGRSGK